MQALSTTPTTQSQEISTASTSSNSTTDLNAGTLPPGTCLSNCTNNNLITNGNVGCSILNNINAASFTDSPSSDLITNGQMSQATTTTTSGPCTAAVSQQSPGSASSASPSSSCSSSSCTSNSASSPSSGISVSVSSPPLQHSVLNGNQMEAVTTVNGSLVMHHPGIQSNQHQQQQQHVHHNTLLGNGGSHLSMSVPRQSHHHSHQQQHNPHPQANANTILSMAANLIAADLTSAPPPVMEQSHVLVDPNGSLIHPALRGVKTVNIGE